MKIDEESMLSLCDSFCAGCTYSMAAEKIGVNVRTVMRWLKSSTEKTDARYQLSFMGERMWLHEAIKLSIKCSVLEAESMARRLSIQGWKENVHFQGRQMFVESEEIVRSGIEDPDELEVCFGQRDKWARDASGNRIPLTVTHRPSATDLQLVLRAHLPQMFGDKREISLNHSGGVLVIGRSAPAAIAPAPLAQIAQEAVEEVMSAPEDVIDAEVVEIEAVEPVEHAAPEMVAEPQPVPRTLPDSPLVRDLMARAQAGPRNPRPSAPVAMMTGSDED